jgi:orotate phosphoribosyltransferase
MKTVLFDLDGTLTDPGEGITKAVAYALASFGIDVPDRTTLFPFIGPPLIESFEQEYGFSREKAERATKEFRVYFQDRGIFENIPYPGVVDFLAALRKAGCRLIVATSKPEEFAERILERFGLRQYFADVVGSTLTEERTRKHEVIAHVLHKYPELTRENTVMVGDRRHDIEGAHKNGLRAVGILWGYGSRAELERAGADRLAASFQELETILLQEDRQMELQNEIAKDLLSIGAVFFRPDEPFTWASGIKSPVYCDNRLILTAPAVRTSVEQAIADTVRREYPGCEALMGTSTAGIAHAAIAGHLLGLPMGYVRSSAKDHGRQNQIEGRLQKGQKVVVVEDLISTGGSVIEVVDVLRAAGAEVLGIVSIFTYGMKKGLDRLAAADVKNVSLCNFDAVAAMAAEEGYIKKDDVRRLLAFRDNPSDESWIGGSK